MNRILKRVSSCLLALIMCLGITCVVNRAVVEYIIADAAEGNYYSSITADSGTSLLGQVHDLITTTHKVYTSYTDCKTPEIIKKTDPGSNSNTVMEFYSQADISATWGSGAVGTWNREHCWCQSLSNGMWGETGGGSDLHHLRPVETRLNSTRGNNKYGLVNNRDNNKVYYKDAGGNNIAHGGYNGGGVYEPLDKVKGDVARIVMYVYTHYNTYSNVHGTTNGNGGSFGTLNFTHVMSANSESAAINLLLQWHNSDPVDNIERTRNEAVYAIQGNRNPFIDHPEYANAIWGDGTTEAELKSISLNKTSLTLTEGKSEQLTVTPDPLIASADVEWTSSDEEVAYVSSNGLITAKSAGTATITATSTVNSSIKATCTVKVEASEFDTVVITLDSFDLSFGYGFKKWSAGGVEGTAFIYGGSSGYPASSMQFNKNQSSYYIASTSPTSGGIKSVTVKSQEGKTDRAWKLLTSNSPYGEVAGKPTDGNDGGTKTVTQEGVTWQVTGSDTYFALTYELTASTGAGYLDSIVIEYDDDGGSVIPPQPPKVIEKLEMHPESLTLDIGDTVKLLVTPTPADAEADIAWMTSNEDIASVSDDGEVTAYEAGTVTITAFCTDNPDIEATCTVTVRAEYKPEPPKVLESLEMHPEQYTMEVEGTINLFVTATPVGASTEVDWSSSNTEIATVSADGKVTALSNGVVTITATSTENSNIKATCRINVLPKDPIVPPEPPVELDKIELRPSSVTLTEGEHVKLELICTPSDTTAEFWWVSSDENIAQVAPDGTVLAKSAGTATITVRCKTKDISATATITVEGKRVPNPPVELEGISLNPSSIKIEQGTVTKINVTCTPAGVTADFRWSSSDESVVEVAQDGTIIAKGVGVATITVTSKSNPNITATATVTVKAKLDRTQIDAFHSAVEGIVTKGTLSQRYASIKSAIEIYNTLSEVEKVEAAADIRKLEAAIAEYNNDANSYNYDTGKNEGAAWGKR